MSRRLISAFVAASSVLAVHCQASDSGRRTGSDIAVYEFIPYPSASGSEDASIDDAFDEQAAAEDFIKLLRAEAANTTRSLFPEPIKVLDRHELNSVDPYATMPETWWTNEVQDETQEAADELLQMITDILAMLMELLGMSEEQALQTLDELLEHYELEEVHAAFTAVDDEASLQYLLLILLDDSTDTVQSLLEAQFDTSRSIIGKL
ncbi:hypothetical protein [Fuerstiella marisgermanici]|uniref:Uncharacterized protein n=1 Tax=Fuerstiella marisgermanici TaxID=1891926 RepID=A0A1P8WRC9_9PLAN|nr:hypothetical protein [Fuerstiella marisgermanici]APZ96613.1 hypothetical protein Fuma_06285 [Fuerstiella marisgermanici]